MEYNDFFKDPVLGEGRPGGTLSFNNFRSPEKILEEEINRCRKPPFDFRPMDSYMRRVERRRKTDLLIIDYLR